MEPNMADVEDDEPTGETHAIEIMRARLHKMNDMLQGHEGKMTEHTILIDANRRQIDGNRRQIENMLRSTASREQVDSMATLHKTQLEGAVQSLTQLINNLKDQLDPIRRGVYWGVSLVLGALIIAVINLLLHGSK
jgi:hypothetical protein